VVFIHGGGWVLGTVDGCDWVCRRLALTAGVAVVSVDYRLSPEAVYPAALEDCVTVLRNVGRLSATFDLDGSAVCVAGESSGGQLAAATCIRARDLGIAVRAQLLVCPVIDPAMDTASWHELGRDHLPVREQMSWMWDLYSGSPEVREGDPLVNLAAQDDLSGLPETIILTSEYDPLRDEAEEYGRRLQKAGVPTDVRRQAGQVHTVFGLARAVTACEKALDETAQELGALLRR
jgi:acetyl esterase